MPLMKMKPTSPGRRGMVRVVSPELYKGEPVKALLKIRAIAAGVIITVVSPRATAAAAAVSITAW